MRIRKEKTNQSKWQEADYQIEEEANIKWILKGRKKKAQETRSGQFRGQKGLGPLEKPREMPYYMFYPRKKINIPDFQKKSAVHWYSMSQRRRRETRDLRRETGDGRLETRDGDEWAGEFKCGRLIFLNRLGQNEKYANFRGKSGIVCI